MEKGHGNADSATAGDTNLILTRTIPSSTMDSHHQPSRPLVGAPTPTPTPTPILKSSSSLASSSSAINPRKRLAPSSLQFSLPPSIKEVSKGEEEDLEESDTDVGSHGLDDNDDDDDDQSFVFGDSDEEEKTPGRPSAAGEDTAENGNGNGTLALSFPRESPPASIGRVGAKVRRLNLNDDVIGARRSSNDSSNSSPARKADADGGPMKGNYLFGGAEAGGDKQVQFPLRRPAGLFNNDNDGGGRFGSPPSSPNIKNISNSYQSNDSPKSNNDNNAMLICPPSTAKKYRGVSRLFANTENDYSNDNHDNASPAGIKINSAWDAEEENDYSNDNIKIGRAWGAEEEEEISPRDVIDFPFFSSSPSKKRGSDKENNFQNTNNTGSVNMMNMSGEDLNPNSPPSTIKKKPNRRMADLNNIDASKLLLKDRPQGLRSHGRANSFMQMFSQEYVDVDVQEEEEGNTNLNGNGNGNANANTNEEWDDSFLHKPSRMDSVGSINGGIDYTMPSPRRPMRSHHKNLRRFPHDNKSNNDENTLDSSNPDDKIQQQQPSSSFGRFAADFQIIGTLGTGTFGSVYKARNRTDLRTYAIKAAKREARGPTDRNRMLREVYALAALSDSSSNSNGEKGGELTCIKAMHVVRYFQAWMEGNRLYMQTELCDLTLAEEVSIGRAANNTMEEGRRYKLLREMLLALDLVHKSGMIHLDIKPENIFIKNDQYKLGDFGLVSKIDNRDDVEEGDSRYMSKELLEGDLDDLTKSDIFSLGATIYEICLARPQPLPENGPEWQDIRKGLLLPMPNTPFDMSMIIREMMAPDPKSRPSAEDLLKRRQLLSEDQRQLIVERNKATAANRALDAQMQRFKLASPKGRKFNRSNTIC